MRGRLRKRVSVALVAAAVRDAPNQPEVRSYRLRYLDGNKAVGDVSDTLTTTTQV